MPQHLITYESNSPGIITISLNDPPTRNAMSEEMAVQFQESITKLKTEKDLRVLIIVGSGDAFCGGGRLDMLFEKTKISFEKNKELMEQFYQQFLSIQDLPVPVIAAINGHAIGAGLCLALACDLRIVKEGAKLGFNFVNLGLHPGMGATYFLPRIVGQTRAAELLYTGKIFSAEYASSIGLVNQVANGDDFIKVVRELSETIAKAGPRAVRELKQSLKDSFNNKSSDLQSCLKREAECQAGDYIGKEFLEGISAAMEKRKPNF